MRSVSRVNDLMKSNKPVLVHITTVPMSLRFLEGQVRFMMSKGLDVHAICSPGQMADTFSRREGVVVHPVRMNRNIKPVHDLYSLFCLWRMLLALQPQIVHAHTPKGGLLGMLGSWLARTPVRIYHVHGLPLMTARGIKRPVLRLTERVACLLANQVICVSNSLREAVVDSGVCVAEKVKVLANGSINGIDSICRFNPERVGDVRSKVRSQSGIADQDLVIGFVGRIVLDKGIVELVEAWRVLREEFPQAHLLVVGPFESHDPLPRGSESVLRNDPRVHLTGDVDNVAPFYAAMDLLVLPSHREGLGLAALEASAMRLPVIATRIPGCIDAVIEGETGLLIPAGDVQALVEAVKQYVGHDELRKGHGSAGRARVLTDFQPEVLWEATYQEYRRLLEEGGISIDHHPARDMGHE